MIMMRKGGEGMCAIVQHNGSKWNIMYFHYLIGIGCECGYELACVINLLKSGPKRKMRREVVYFWCRICGQMCLQEYQTTILVITDVELSQNVPTNDNCLSRQNLLHFSWNTLIWSPFGVLILCQIACPLSSLALYCRRYNCEQSQVLQNW